jgi:hypothetical protein
MGEARRWNFSGVDYGRWKRGSGGDGMRSFLEGEEVDDTVKSGATAREAEGDSGWRLEVEDDRRKLGRWAECAVGPNCVIKIGE